MNTDTLDNEADPIVRYSEMRTVTDYSINPSLILAALLSWILWALYVVESRYRPISHASAIPFATSLSAITLAAFVATVPVAYLVYSIVNRRNVHFERSEGLLRASIGRLKNNTNPADMARMFAVNTAERDLLAVAVDDKERSAYAWSLLSLVPFIGGLFLAYALSRVTGDFQRHEQREFATIEDLQRALGLPVGHVSVQPQRWYPSRNSIAYFLVSIFTAGLFSIYWLYSATHDPKAHFEIQSHLENELQPLLTGLRKFGSSSTGGAI
jgi:H+/Cl- antiporter ClcA